MAAILKNCVRTSVSRTLLDLVPVFVFLSHLVSGLPEQDSSLNDICLCPEQSTSLSYNADLPPMYSYLSFILDPLTEQAMAEENIGKILDLSMQRAGTDQLRKNYKFKPLNILTQLADSARAAGTSPDEFRKELEELVGLLSPYRETSSGNRERSVILALKPSKLEQLKNKYNVTSDDSAEPESVTPTRLISMFPHYLKLGRKTPASFTPPKAPEGYHGRVPFFFACPEFGGLLPFQGLPLETLEPIFNIHSYVLKNQFSVDKTVIFSWHVSVSQAPEDVRIQFLQDNGVLTKDKKVTKEISELADSIQTELVNTMLRRLFRLNDVEARKSDSELEA